MGDLRLEGNSGIDMVYDIVFCCVFVIDELCEMRWDLVWVL